MTGAAGAPLLRPIGESAAQLAVRVTPRGGRDALDGLDQDAAGRAFLRLRVSAAPSDGAANAAVIKLLARIFGVPKSAIDVVAGQTARVKQIRVRGAPAELERRLAEALKP